MIRSLAAIVLVAMASFAYTDLDSDSAIRSVMLPLLDIVALVALAIWFALLFHKHGVNQTDGASTSDGSGFMGDGGDGGGGA